MNTCLYLKLFQFINRAKFLLWFMKIWNLFVLFKTFMNHNKDNTRFTNRETPLKYRGPILHVTSPALGSDDLTLDQSATSIQILPEPALVTWHIFYKITTLPKSVPMQDLKIKSGIQSFK